MYKNLFKQWSKWSAAVALGVACAPSAMGACTYTVNGEWSTGFNATVRISNSTTSTINGWNVQWQYAGNNRVTQVWNANRSGNNPYSANNLSWNANILPGRFVEFGVQGSKQPGAAEIPSISGTGCNADVNSTAGRVYIQVDKADDHLFLYVDGVEKMRWSVPQNAHNWDSAVQARLGEKIDITHLLAQGQNQLRIIASADNGEYLYGGYSVKLWKGNQMLINAAEDVFWGPPHTGILLEETVNVELAQGPARRSLTVNSTSGEAVYLNNVFTGKYAPTTFQLAPGEYRVGLGESTITADHPNNTVHVTGRYRQQDLVIGNQNVTLNAAQVPVLDKVNVWRVAAVPYMTVYQGLTRAQADAGVLPPANNIGRLTADDIAVAEKSLNVTSEKWLLPMSYGLMKWDVTMLPPVTVPVYHPYDVNVGHELRWNPSMINADLSQYDLVVHIIPTRTGAVDAQDNRLFITSTHGGYAGRPDAFMPQDWLDGEGNDLATRLQNVKPSPGMLHESLHGYDNYRLNDYNGIDQLHGAEVHGYRMNACGLPSEWVCWYIHYIRSQVGENQFNQYGVQMPNPLPPGQASTFVGIFNLMREGRGAAQYWSYSKPVSQIRNLGTQSCIDVIDAADNTPIVAWSCQGGNNQLWSFRRIQNGAYQLISENSQKCAEFVDGNLLQKTCGVSLAQRYVLQTAADGSIAIKTLGGQCLAFSSGDDFVLETCGTNQPRQSWKFQ